MARKKATPVEEPPSASSSEEEEEMSSEGGGGEESEEESSSEEEEEAEKQAGAKTPKPSSLPPQPTPPPQPQTQTQTPKPAPQKPDSVDAQAGSDSEGESDSGSESDESESEPERTVKPISSKPMAVEETPVKTTNPRSKPSEQRSEKRVSETDLSSTDAKRAKKKDVDTAENSEDTKKQLKGKWSEDDEIALLEGILEYTKKKGIDPRKDLSKEIDSFREFIKKRLHLNVNSSQLKDKIWRTKKKFNRKDLTFSKPHDQKLLDMTKKLWGSASIGGDGVESSFKSNVKVKSDNNINQRGKSKTLAALKVELGMDTTNEVRDQVGKTEIDVSRTFGWKSFDEMADYVLNKGLDVMSQEKKAEMDEKWKELRVEEIKLFLKRLELLKEQTKLTLAYYKGQGP